MSRPWPLRWEASTLEKSHSISQFVNNYSEHLHISGRPVMLATIAILLCEGGGGNKIMSYSMYNYSCLSTGTHIHAQITGVPIYRYINTQPENCKYLLAVRPHTACDQSADSKIAGPLLCSYSILVYCECVSVYAGRTIQRHVFKGEVSQDCHVFKNTFPSILIVPPSVLSFSTVSQNKNY